MQIVHKIESNLNNYNYTGCQKTRKIEYKAKKFLKASKKVGYGEISKLLNFFNFLGLVGSKNSFACIFLVFEAQKAIKATKGHNIESMHRCGSIYVNLVF